MAAIEKPVNPTRVVTGTPITDGGPATPVASPVVAPTGGRTPDLSRFTAITGGGTGGYRSILARGNPGPIDAIGIRFSSARAAADQALVENGLDHDVLMMQQALDVIS